MGVAAVLDIYALRDVSQIDGCLIGTYLVAKGGWMTSIVDSPSEQKA